MAQGLWARSKAQIYLPCHQLVVLTGTIIRNSDTIYISLHNIIFRYFKHLGYKTRYVRNITDAGHLENDADQGHKES